MGLGATPAHPAGLARGDIASILDWWKLAGVDMIISDEPTAWFSAPGVDPAAGHAPPAPEAQPARPPHPAERGWWSTIETLADLAAQMAARHPRAPFADGNPQSGLMILGETPSAEDLHIGRPFTGPAGRLLDRMLAAIGVDRTSCYIALLCPRRPVPGPPTPEDIAQDIALTRAHVRLAAPRHLLLLGANPVQALSGETAPITRIRGSWLSVDAGGDALVPALATFNPAYLLRRPEEKARAWTDLLALKHRLSQ
jgi:DNA polymerase